MRFRSFALFRLFLVRPEVIDAVTSRFQACREGGPCWRGEWRILRLKHSLTSLLTQFLEIGHISPLDEGMDDTKCQSISTKDDCTHYMTPSSSSSFLSLRRVNPLSALLPAPTNPCSACFSSTKSSSSTRPSKLYGKGRPMLRNNVGTRS